VEPIGPASRLLSMYRDWDDDEIFEHDRRYEEVRATAAETGGPADRLEAARAWLGLGARDRAVLGLLRLTERGAAEIVDDALLELAHLALTESRTGFADEVLARVAASPRLRPATCERAALLERRHGRRQEEERWRERASALRSPSAAGS
jgi:hypothetical protein